MTTKSVAIKVQPHSWTDAEFERASRRMTADLAMQRGMVTVAEQREIGISRTRPLRIHGIETLVERAA